MRYLVSSHPQGSPEWKLARAGYATGSKAAAICAKIKTGEAKMRSDYRWQIVTERLRGEPMDGNYQSDAMKWGVQQEPFARMAYEEWTGNIVLEAGFLYLPDVRAGCSVDGLINDDGMLEIKCPNSDTHLEYMEGDRLPPLIRPQVLHNLWVTGRAYCDFVSFDPRLPDNLQLFVHRYKREQSEIETYALEVLAFLDEVDAMEKRLRGKKHA